MIICVALMQPIKNELEKMPIHLLKPLGLMGFPFLAVVILLHNGNAIGTDDKFDASSRDADYFTIRNWLGL
jgi:hypothetical protein